MAFFSSAKSIPGGRDKRKAPRRKLGTDGWIRAEGGFAVQRCQVVDLSDGGVQIALSNPSIVERSFTFMQNRAGRGRRARVIRRSGTKICAQFE